MDVMTAPRVDNKTKYTEERPETLHWLFPVCPSTLHLFFPTKPTYGHAHDQLVFTYKEFVLVFWCITVTINIVRETEKKTKQVRL